MRKVLKITGEYGYAGTDFEYFVDITGKESDQELEEMAREEVLNCIDWNWEVVNEDEQR